MDGGPLLAGSDELLAEMAAVARVGAWELDTATDAWRGTSEAARILALPETTTRAAFLAAIAAGERAALAAAIDAALAHRRAFDLELELAASAGGRRWVRATGRARSAATVRGGIHDVTEQRGAGANSEAAVLRRFIATAPGACAMFDREMRILAASPRYCADLGLGAEAIVDRHLYAVVPDVPERWREVHRRCLAGATERGDEDPMHRADGTTEWFTWEFRPWHDAAGAIGGIVLFGESVTARKRAELALQQTAARYADIFDRAPVGLAEIDETTNRYVQVNPPLCAFLGRSARELIGMHWLDVTHPEDRAAGVAAVAAHLAGEQPLITQEKRYVRPDGSIVWGRLTGRSDLSASRPGTRVVAIADITQARAQATELARLDARMRAMYDAAPLGMALVQRGTGAILSTNPRLSEMLEYTREELAAVTFGRIVDPADREMARAAVDRARAQLVPVRFEARYVRKSGTAFWSAVQITPVRDGVGAAETFVVTFEDISSRRAAEATRRLQASALEAIGSAMAILDAAGRIDWINPAFAQLTGHSLAQLQELPPQQLWGGMQAEGAFRERWAALARGEVWHAELVIRRADGTIYDEEQTITPVRDGSGTISHFIAIKQDITARKRAESAMRASEARLRTALGGLPIPVLLADATGRVLQYNAAFSARFGYALADAPTLDAWFEQAFPDADLRAAAERAWTSDLTRTTGTGERALPDRALPVRCKDGRILQVEIVARRVDQQLLAVFHDVTDLLRATAALVDAEEHERLALETAELATWRIDLKSQRVELDARARALFGIDRSSLPLAELWARVHPDDAITDDALTSASKLGSARVVRRILLPGGECRWVAAQVRYQYEGSGAQRRAVLATVIGRDITTERIAEDALRTSEERYRTLVDSLDDVVFAVDAAGTLTFISRAVTSYGYAPEEVVGRHLAELAHPQDRSALAALPSATTLADLGRPLESVLHDRAGKPRHVRIQVRRAADGNGIAGVIVDLTAMRSTEEQLRAAQRMEAIGRLAGGVAHDFNNLLTVIMSYAELAQSALGEDDPTREDIDEILHAASRATGLTRQLLAFSRRQVLHAEPIDLDDLVASLAKMLHRLIGEDIELRLLYSADRKIALVDRGQIEQVIMNLVVNARDAMPDGGTITLATDVRDLDEVTARAADVPPGPYTRIVVADNGSGMDAATVSRVFEPFFTTKPQGKGTGLGLSTAYGIVKQSRGGIAVQSEPGVGTAFAVYLPIAVAGETRPTPRRASGAVRGDETILVVEDEAPLRAAVVRVLTTAGYHALSAATPSEATHIARQHGAAIRLILTDVVMPEMNGRDLAGILSPLCPAARVLYVSGYTDDELVRSGVLGQAFLAKPFDPTTLSRRIRTLLDDTDGA